LGIKRKINMKLYNEYSSSSIKQNPPKSAEGERRRIKINLSTGWRFDLPPTFKKSFIWAKELGFNGLELVINSENLFHSKTFIKKLSEKHQVPILSIHCPLITTSYFWPLKRGVEKTLDYASFLGASLVVIHPPYMKGYLYSGGRKLVDYLTEKQKEYPEIKITIENFEEDKKGTNRSLESLNDLLEKYKIGLTLDTTHIGFTNYDLFYAYKLFKDKIKNIHLSNQEKFAEHLPPYQGRLPLAQFLKKLKEDNYQENITIELLYAPWVSAEKVKSDLGKSINFIKRALNE
jgi:sugar phosphate isomerase/epimerase